MKTFTQTSDVPYDRHTYRIHLKSLATNKTTIDFDDFQLAKSYWLSNRQIPHYLDYIEVLDKSQSKGFK